MYARILFLFLVFCLDVEAKEVNRSPSMSRVNIAPPNRGPFNRQQAIIRVQQYQTPTHPIDPATVSKLQSSYKTNLPQQRAANKQITHRASQSIRQNRAKWFTPQFFERHHFHPSYLGNGWGVATWAGVVTWLNGGWSYPYYYDDSGYPLQVEAPPPLPVTQEEEGDWMPLGVFAVVQDPSQAEFAHRFLQLALNREGEIEGTYYNALSDTTQNVIGTVNKVTQQVVLQLADNPDSPIGTTGLYNLTQDQTPVQVHFSDGSVQTWTWIRLEG